MPKIQKGSLENAAAAGGCGRFTSLLVVDLVDRAIRNRNDVEVAIGTLLDGWGGPESSPDQERLAFSRAELCQIVGDTIGEPRIRDIDLHAVARQCDPERATAGSPDVRESTWP